MAHIHVAVKVAVVTVGALIHNYINRMRQWSRKRQGCDISPTCPVCELQGENQKANVEKVNASPGGKFPLRAEAEIILSTVKAM